MRVDSGPRVWGASSYRRLGLPVHLLISLPHLVAGARGARDLGVASSVNVVERVVREPVVDAGLDRSRG